MRKETRSAVGGNACKGRDWTKVRLAFVAVMFGLAWAALWVRAFQVQVLDGEKLAARADRQHVAMEYARGERGKILDRKGRVLAKSVAVHSVFVRPGELEDPRRAAGALAKILDEPAASILQKFGSAKPFVWIKRGIGDKPAADIRQLDEPGLGLLVEYGRTYPNGHLAGQLMGFAGLDGQGLEGLERSFDKHLVGRRVGVAVQRDAGGSRLYLEAGPDAAGRDLNLTLDADIQYMAEKALAQAVDKHKAQNGVLLMVDVHSAEILAWAQYPFFNPNVFNEYKPSAWRNRAVMDALEPGSTLKPFLVAAALEEGVVQADTKYFCEQGTWSIKGATFNDTHEYGDLNISDIIRLSSNIGAAKMGLDLGARVYKDYLSRLGFGRRTEVPLPGENPGIVRPASQWTQVDLAAASFGQGLSATTLQIAQAYLCLASHGVLRPLRIAREAQEPVQGETRVFSRQVAASVLSMLREVVQGQGTGAVARIPGLDVGGKTGTAQKASPAGGYGDSYVASFVGLYPALEPKYLVIAVIDDPKPHHYGSVVAAPAVKQVALESLSYLGELPDAAQEETGDEHVLASLDEIARSRALIVHDVQTAPGRVPDVVGLPVRRAVEAFVRAGCVPAFRGEGGFVERQSPQPGREWPENERPVLWLTGRG